MKLLFEQRFQSRPRGWDMEYKNIGVLYISFRRKLAGAATRTAIYSEKNDKTAAQLNAYHHASIHNLTSNSILNMAAEWK